MQSRRPSSAPCEPGRLISCSSPSIKSKFSCASGICSKPAIFILNWTFNARPLKTRCERARRNCATRSSNSRKLRAPSAQALRSQLLAAMRAREIKRGTKRNDARRINIRVRHIIMTLDVIEVDRLRDPRLLIKIHQVALQIRIIDHPPDVAFEVTVINDIETDERAKQTPIHFDDALAE